MNIEFDEVEVDNTNIEITPYAGFACGVACENGMVCGLGCGHGVGGVCGTGCSK